MVRFIVFLACSLLCAICLWAAETSPAGGEDAQVQDAGGVINFVVIPDAHTRTGTLVFLPQIVDRINALDIQPDFVVSLGDNVSGGEDHEVLADAVAYEREISRLKAKHHYVIGNHECIPVEVYKLLTWEQLLGAWGMKSRWYSFDIRGFHVCVLDGWVALQGDAFADDFRREREWLVKDLQATDKPTIVFVHQAIGFQQQDCQEWIDSDNRKFWPPGNFLEVTLEEHARKIVGVFEGHKHKSIVKTQSGVVYHQMGASHVHNGQFAQVFIDPDTREYFVLGHPEVASQNYQQNIQQTYGERRVMERVQE